MSTMRKYRYYLPDHGMSPEDYFEVECLWDDDTPGYIAEDAGKNYHDAHDGWEAHWPLEIVVLDGDKELGRFSVSREHIPQFYARPIKRETATPLNPKEGVR